VLWEGLLGASAPLLAVPFHDPPIMAVKRDEGRLGEQLVDHSSVRVLSLHSAFAALRRVSPDA
jgi:hypothetical protein